MGPVIPVPSTRQRPLSIDEGEGADVCFVHSETISHSQVTCGKVLEPELWGTLRVSACFTPLNSYPLHPTDLRAPSGSSETSVTGLIPMK